MSKSFVNVVNGVCFINSEFKKNHLGLFSLGIDNYFRFPELTKERAKKIREKALEKRVQETRALARELKRSPEFSAEPSATELMFSEIHQSKILEKARRKELEELIYDQYLDQEADYEMYEAYDSCLAEKRATAEAKKKRNLCGWF